MRDNEKLQHSPRILGLSGTQFPTLKSVGFNDPEGPEKYNNNDVKNGAIFYTCQTAVATFYCEYKDLDKL
jgi:hypothetical protein